MLYNFIEIETKSNKRKNAIIICVIALVVIAICIFLGIKVAKLNKNMRKCNKTK